MDFFDMEFETQKSQEMVWNIVNTISRYDIYDFIARASGLNLLSQNQNKAVLIDTLIQYIISDQKEKYKSKAKISDKKFKSIMDELGNTYLSASIDPCENVFVQNVMFNGENYRVYNGIDITPAYNLQSLIRILFGYNNQFDSEYLMKVNRLLSLLLGISEETIRQSGIEIENIQYNEEREIVVPSGEVVRRYADLVSVPFNRLYNFVDGFFSVDELLIDFGVEETGSIDNRPFYTRPFLKDAENNRIIILNIALLPEFAFYKAIEWAEYYNIKNELVNRFNEYIWIESKITLDKMGHKKVNEKAYGLECVSYDYYKEAILTVYNNQLMFLFYICDDGEDYSKDELHNRYPDDRHSTKFQERLKYYRDNLYKLKVYKEDTYFLVILNSFGRSMGVGYNDHPFGYKPITLYPFDLHCISINESENNAFLPRYIRAKSQLNMMLPNLFSELNAVCIYTNNKNSFYMSDDVDPDVTSIYIAPGDSVEYISKALQKENRILIDAYGELEKTEAVLVDKKRNIYNEETLFSQDYMAFCIIYENIKIWIKTDRIVDAKSIDIFWSLLDCISYWLSECKSIIELYDFPYSVYTIHLFLTGNMDEYYYYRQDISPFEDSIDLSIERNQVYLTFKPEAFGNLNRLYNDQEKELCRFIIDIFDDISCENRDYSVIFDSIFRNPLKKKFYSADFEKKPYLKPLRIENHRIVHGEDEDYLSDIIGKELLMTGKWKIGTVDNSQRVTVSNAVVGMLYNRLESKVAEFEPDHMIEVIYQDLEETLYRLMLAERRYYSDVACYPENEDKLIENYNNLNKTSLALKFLIEYVTARPSSGAKHFGIGQYEELLAICSMIINWAYRSDLFKYGIINSPITILNSKRIGMVQDEFIDMYQYGNKYRQRQLKYDSSRVLRKAYNVNTIGYGEELDTAFISEFGYSYSSFVQIIVTMVALNDKEIICVPESNIVTMLMNLDDTLQEEVIAKVLDDIVYEPRNDYLTPPKGFDKEDAYPWRFNRKYSFNRRPVLRRDDKLIWGNRQLYHMVEYLTDLIYAEKFKSNSEEMKTLCGKIAKRKGKIFNDLVVELIRGMQEFTIYSQVKKINGKKIAENGNELGDVDILIIDKEMKKIIVTEVKNFRFSRNPREINIEYEKMFADKKKTSFSTKHNKRTKWINEHIDDVKQAYGLEDGLWTVVGLFIVNQPLISQFIYKQSIKCISVAELCVEALKSV